MKIAIATNDMIQVAAHAGRAKHYVIVDVTDDNIITGQTVVRNNLTHHHTHGPDAHNHSHAEGQGGHSHTRLTNALQGCDYFVAASMGPKLIADLEKIGIKPVTCGSIDIEDAAIKVVKGDISATPKPCK